MLEGKPSIFYLLNYSLVETIEFVYCNDFYVHYRKNVIDIYSLPISETNDIFGGFPIMHHEIAR